MIRWAERISVSGFVENDCTVTCQLWHNNVHARCVLLKLLISCQCMCISRCGVMLSVLQMVVVYDTTLRERITSISYEEERYALQRLWHTCVLITCTMYLHV